MTIYKQNKQTRFQIIADTGETLGLPLATWELAESIIQEILDDEEYFQELCPDSDVSKIKWLEIISTTDY